MLIADKISWWIDLEKVVEESWAKRSLKEMRAKKERYDERVGFEILPNTQIRERFFPLYMRTVARKKNYHLSLVEVEKKIEQMERDESYQLIWLQDKESGKELGGNIVRLTPEMIKTVYRSYDHQLTKELGLKIFDYYADYVLQEWARDKGRWLNRGVMQHPIDGVGLTIFKLRTGALPRVAKKGKTRDWNDSEIAEFVDKWGMFGYFSQADDQGWYKKFRVMMQQNDEEKTMMLKKQFGRVGIELEIEN